MKYRDGFMLRLLQSDKGRQIDFEAGRRAIALLEQIPLAAWPEQFIDHYIGDLEDLTPGGQEALKHLQARELLQDLAIVEEAVLESSRHDVWAGEIGNKFVVLAGGPRYAPAMTAVSLDRLELAGVAQTMGFDFTGH